MKKLVFLLVLIGSCLSTSNCCSAFKYVVGDQVYVAKNFDWFSGEGYLIKNNRNQKKCTYLEYGGRNTCWTSKYGSVTFNQNGKEFPYGGINEAGLVVEMLWLKETNYEEEIPDSTVISELEWIQYQLDNFGTVEELKDNLSKLEIDPMTATIHYFATDQTGESVIIEFINGTMSLSESTGLIQCITNSSVSVSQTFYKENKPLLGNSYVPKNPHSNLRFCSIQNNLEKFPTEKDFGLNQAFELLEKVTDDKEIYKTYWTIVYDLNDLSIVFKTYDNPVKRSLKLADLNFDSNISTCYDLSAKGSEKTLSDLMEAYTSTYNEKLIENCIKPQLMFDYDQLNIHQMTPSSSFEDEIFASNHMDVTVFIHAQIPKGTVRYFLADSELNYRRQGPYGGSVEITEKETVHKLYSLRKNTSYAYGAMHDINGNGYLDRNFIKMPKEPFAFSGKKRFIFFPPKFHKAMFEITEEVTIKVK